MKELSIGVNLPTKENIEEAANNFIDMVKNGEIDPVEAAVKLKGIEAICEQIREGISECVVNELDKQQGKATKLGAKIERKEVGTKWDYTNSEAWKVISKQKDVVGEKLKAVEAIAKSVPVGTETIFTDTDTGETLIVVHGTKTSKTSYSVTLGK